MFRSYDIQRMEILSQDDTRELSPVPEDFDEDAQSDIYDEILWAVYGRHEDFTVRFIAEFERREGAVSLYCAVSGCEVGDKLTGLPARSDGKGWATVLSSEGEFLINADGLPVNGDGTYRPSVAGVSCVKMFDLREFEETNGYRKNEYDVLELSYTYVDPMGEVKREDRLYSGEPESDSPVALTDEDDDTFSCFVLYEYGTWSQPTYRIGKDVTEEEFIRRVRNSDRKIVFVCGVAEDPDCPKGDAEALPA